MARTGRKFLKDLLYSFLIPLVRKIQGLIFIPIITKIIGSQGYGIWTQYGVTITLISIFASLNLGFATNRFLTSASDERIKEDYYSVTAITLILSVAVSMALYLFRHPISSFLFNDPGESEFVVLMAVVLVFHMYMRQTNQFLRSQRRIRLMSLFRSGRSVGEILSLALATVVFGSLFSMVLAVVVFDVLAALLLAGYVTHLVGVGAPRFRNMKEYLRFSLPTVFSSAAYWVVNTSDRYVVTFFLGITSVGIYSVIYSLTTLVHFIASPIINVLFPDITELKEEDNMELYGERVRYAYKYYIFFSIPSIVGLIVLSRPIIEVLSTTEIADNGDLVPYLAFAMFFYGAFHLVVQVLNSYDMTAHVSAIWGAISLLNIVLNLVLVPTIGLLGAAIATLASFFLGTAIGLALYPDEQDFPVSTIRVIIKSGFASALMGAAVYFASLWMQPVDPVELVLLVFLGVTVYFLAALLNGLLGRKELRYVQELL